MKLKTQPEEVQMIDRCCKATGTKLTKAELCENIKANYKNVFSHFNPEER